jgi:hypothetical protein
VGGGLYYWIVLTMGQSTHLTYLSIDLDDDDDQDDDDDKNDANDANNISREITTVSAAPDEGFQYSNVHNLITSYQNKIISENETFAVYSKVCDIRPYHTQMLTEPVLLLCFFFSIHFMNNAYTLTTMRDFLGIPR